MTKPLKVRGRTHQKSCFPQPNTIFISSYWWSSSLAGQIQPASWCYLLFPELHKASHVAQHRLPPLLPAENIHADRRSGGRTADNLSVPSGYGAKVIWRAGQPGLQPARLWAGHVQICVSQMCAEAAGPAIHFESLKEPDSICHLVLYSMDERERERSI